MAKSNWLFWQKSIAITNLHKKTLMPHHRVDGRKYRKRCAWRLQTITSFQSTKLFYYAQTVFRKPQAERFNVASAAKRSNRTASRSGKANRCTFPDSLARCHWT